MTFKRQRLIGDVGILCETCDVMSEDAALSGEKCCAPLTRRPVTFPLSFQRHNEPRPRLRAAAFFTFSLIYLLLELPDFFTVGIQAFCNHE